ncbi:MAG TPA: DUF3037 domain-containing protein [Mucilaginibacter sp.]|jgi:hypothetical protein|nr:DUF3037 domain-containing protein [Mucilaginibacter sp.]
MQENNLFEYAVIRVVPQVEREEFLNVGVILYCPKLKFLQCLCEVDEKRLCSFSNKIDIDDLKGHLHSFAEICRGGKDGGPIAQLDMASRFRWLSATRSTVVQTSKVHPGLCIDPAETLKKLYAQLVL